MWFWCGSGVVVVFFAHVLFGVYFWRQTHLPEHWLRVDAELFPWSGSATSWCFHCSLIKSCHVKYFFILTIMAASSYLNQQDIEAEDTYVLMQKQATANVCKLAPGLIVDGCFLAGAPNGLAHWDDP